MLNHHRNTIFSLALSLSCIIAISASETSQFLEGTSDSKNPGILNTPFQECWKIPVGPGYGQPVILTGKILIHHGKKGTETLDCLESSTGKNLWSLNLPGTAKTDYPGPRATPLVMDERIFVQTEGAIVVAASMAGKELWRCDLNTLGAKGGQWGLSGSPIPLGKDILIQAGGKNSGLILLRASDGQVLRRGLTITAGYSTPCIASPKLILLAAADAVIGVNAETFAETWRFPWQSVYGITGMTPLLLGKDLFFGSGLGAGSIRLSLPDSPMKPSVLWKNPTFSPGLCTPVATGGHLYGFSSDSPEQSRFCCVQIDSGKVLWSEKLGPGAGQVVLADGLLAILTGQGDFLTAQVDPVRFSPSIRRKVFKDACWAAPTFGSGLMALRSDSTLAIFGRGSGATMASLDLKRTGKSEDRGRLWYQKLNPATAKRLLVFFHGGTQAAEAQYRWWEQSRLLDPTTALLCPQSKDPVNSWDQEQDDAFIEGLITQIASDLKLPSRAIIIGGHSKGGAYAAYYASMRQTKIGGLLACCAPIMNLPAAVPDGLKSFVFYYSPNDPLAKQFNPEPLLAEIKKQKYPLEIVSDTVGHNLGPKMKQAWDLVHTKVDAEIKP